MNDRNFSELWKFPSELTWAIDPLLQYVKDFQVNFLLFAGDS
jgi:hypothetical protein